MSVLLCLVVACSGSPTSAGDDGPVPTGIILAATPNGQEAGTYLIDIATGDLTQISDHGNPLSVAVEGRYSGASRFIYGRRTAPEPRDLMQLSLMRKDTAVLLAWPTPDLLAGAYDLSADERLLAIQTLNWPSARSQLSIVDLALGTWTPIIDNANRIDTIPLTSIRWSPDGTRLYAVTDLWPDRSELVRIDLSTQQFRTLSPVVKIDYEASVDVSLDGQLLAFGDAQGRVSFRDRDGDEVTGYPAVPAGVSRPVFSPDGRFLAFQEFGPAPDGGISITLMRLSDGKRWPLKVNADFEVWLSDWI